MAKQDKNVQTFETPAAEAPAFRFDFVFQVINPFGRYEKGALIASDDAIQAVIDSGMAFNCNRIARH